MMSIQCELRAHLPPTTLLGAPSFFFFFNDTATTEIYTLSLHDALPIFFFDQHRGGESGNNAADSPPWAIRYNPANPSTFGATNLAPFHDVFLGRPDIFPVIDLKNAGSTLAPFPTPIVLETYADTYQTPRTY